MLGLSVRLMVSQTFYHKQRFEHFLNTNVFFTLPFCVAKSFCCLPATLEQAKAVADHGLEKKLRLLFMGAR